MRATWAAMEELIVHRHTILHPGLCWEASCGILQFLNQHCVLSVHTFGTLSSYFMFCDDFLQSMLTPVQYQRLMLTVDPYQTAQEQGICAWENYEPRAESDVCYEIRATDEPLSKEEIEMLSCVELLLDEGDTGLPAPVDSNLTPAELLLYLQQSDDDHDATPMAGIESPPAFTEASMLPCVRSMASTPNSLKRPRTQWSEEEDARLIAFHEAHGPRWRAMSREFGHRSDDAYRNRFLRINGQGYASSSSSQLKDGYGSDDSSSSSSSFAQVMESQDPVKAYAQRAKRKEWTLAEDNTILAFIDSVPDTSCTRWSQLACQLTNRSPHAIRNRAYRLTESIKRGSYAPNWHL